MRHTGGSAGARTRRDVAVRRTIGAAVGLALAATGLVACGAPDDTHALARAAFTKTKTKRLPGGDRIAYGSPDGHRVVVQWRGKGATGWSAPTTVYTDRRYWTHDIDVTAQGGSVAVEPDYWEEEVLDDDYAPDHVASVICVDRTCEKGHRTASHAPLNGTSFAEDGRYAVLPVSPGRAVLWQAGEFRTARVSGLPGDPAYRLLPDGSLIAVVAARGKDGCRTTLLTTKRHGTSFTRQAAGPVVPASGGSCAGADAEKVSTDEVTFFDESTVSRFSFVRDGDSWSYDGPQRPLVAYPDTKGRSSIANSTNVLHDGTTVSVGSPDDRRILVQTRAEGQKDWSTPRQVATAPAGTVCRQALFEPQEGADGVITVGCYRPGTSYDPAADSDPDVVIALASRGGARWDRVDLPRGSLSVGLGAPGDYVVQGRAATAWWHHGRGWRTIALPSSAKDAVLPSPDGTQALRIGGDLPRAAGSRGGCDLRFQVAPVGAKAWPGTSTPFPEVPAYVRDGSCFVDAYGGAHGAYEVTVGNQDYEGSLMLRDGHWVPRAVSSF